MIKKISSVNLDAFENFSWSSSDLKRLNLFYGWNGSGKTTLSRILQSYELGALPDLLPPSSQFSVSTNTGSINQSAIASHDLKIKVFNEDFIHQHLNFDEGSANVIVTIGTGSKTLLEQISSLEESNKKVAVEINTLISERPKETRLKELLKEASDKVANEFSGTQLAGQGYYGRSYNVSTVKKILEAEEITSLNITDHILSDDQIEQKLDFIKNSKTSVSAKFTHVDDFEDVLSDVNEVLLHDMIVIEDITELSSDSQLKDWVETGFKLHIDKQLSVCAFCESSLSKERLERLSKFYTKELKAIKDKITLLNTNLNPISCDDAVASFDESSQLFQEQANDFSAIKSKLANELKKIQVSIENATRALQLKTDHLEDSTLCLIPIVYPKNAIDRVNEYCDQLNALVSTHNALVSARDEVIVESGKELEYHLIADVLSHNDYFATHAKCEQLSTKIDGLRNSLDASQKDLANKKGQLKNVQDAIVIINKLLDEFFGEGFLAIDPNGDMKTPQYHLKRRGVLAKHLSEGEKSIIALCYFIASMQEDGFNLNEGVVIIDDPVDSQDANHLYKTGSLIKNCLKEAKQLLIMTHNFDFFNIIRDWFQSDGYIDQSTHHQIRYEGGAGDHSVFVEELPRLLVQHKSEYQYLFFHLYQFSCNRGSIDDPLVANIARRILESFASFKWSTKSTTAFLNIVQDKFIDDKSNRAKQVAGEAVYKFVNEYSHNLNFSRDITATTMNSLEIAKKTLSFIKYADPEHYNAVRGKCDAEISSAS